jgi:hypothetical protein
VNPAHESSFTTEHPELDVSNVEPISAALMVVNAGNLFSERDRSRTGTYDRRLAPVTVLFQASLILLLPDQFRCAVDDVCSLGCFLVGEGISRSRFRGRKITADFAARTTGPGANLSGRRIRRRLVTQKVILPLLVLPKPHLVPCR